MVLSLKDTLQCPLYIYRKEIKGYILLYNPRLQGEMTLIPKRLNKLFMQIDGKNSIGDLLKKSNLNKTELYLFLYNLLHSEIIYLKRKKNTNTGLSKIKTNDLFVWVYLTEQCNFRCTYCFIDKNPKKMISQTVVAMINKLAIMKKKYNLSRIKIRLAGGEPLLEMELIKELISNIRNVEKIPGEIFQVGVITNGSLLTKESAGYFSSNNIGLTISLDGIAKQNNITRRFSDGSGTFEHIKKGLLLARENNILKNINITITPGNIKGVPDVVKYCLTNNITMRFGFFKQTNGVCGGDVIENPSSIIPTYKKILSIIYDFYRKNKIRRSPLIDHSLLDDLNYKGGQSQNHCGAGASYFSISTDGKITLCPASNMTLATVYDSDFIKKARLASSPFLKKMSVEHIPKCQKCYWKYTCGGGCMLERFNRSEDKPIPSYKCNIYKSIMPIILNLEAKRILNANCQK